MGWSRSHDLTGWLVPVISMFHGIVIRMYTPGNQQHWPARRAEVARWRTAAQVFAAGSGLDRATSPMNCWHYWALAVAVEKPLRIDPLRGKGHEPRTPVAASGLMPRPPVDARPPAYPEAKPVTVAAHAENPHMTFGQFLSILRARWWVALLVLALTVATTRGGEPAAAQAVHRHAPAWWSTSSPTRSRPSSSAAAVAGLHGHAGRHHQQRARGAARGAQPEAATRTRRCASSGWTKPAARAPSSSWLVDVFQKQLDVMPSRESSVISHQLQGARPALRRRPGQRLCAGLHRHHAGTARRPGASSIPPSSTTRAKEARETLEKAQSRL